MRNRVGGVRQVQDIRSALAPKARPSRRGYVIPRWPKMDLAKIKVVSIRTGLKGEPLLEAVRLAWPGLATAYKERTGRALTAHVLEDRLDKGMRQLEELKYQHLIAQAWSEYGN